MSKNRACCNHYSHYFISTPDLLEQPDHFKLVKTKTKYERQSKRLGIYYSKEVQEKRSIGRPNIMLVSLYGLRTSQQGQTKKQRKRWQRLLTNEENKRRSGQKKTKLTSRKFVKRTGTAYKKEKIKYTSIYHKKYYVDNRTHQYNGEPSKSNQTRNL